MDKAPIFPKAEEVLLPRAPLIAVLGQVRFEPILSIQNPINFAPFQDAVRSQYPILRKEMRFSARLTAEGAVKNKTAIWRLFDPTEKWRISLSSDFIAIQTMEYKSRDEFLNKFKFALEALNTHFQPGLVTRTGIRYIDKLSGDDLGKIRELVKPELLGVLSSEIQESIKASINEAHFEIGSHRLFSRWGLIPPNGTIDPAVIKPQNTVSWILDIDTTNPVRKTWNLNQLSEEFSELADINYSFFRWAVKKEFLENFGAVL